MRVRATLDSNVLVYSELDGNTEKGRRATSLIAASDLGGVLAVQALLEFAAVVRRKRPERLTEALESIAAWTKVFQLAPTTLDVAQAALRLSVEHNFQIWDAVIWSAARQAGAVLFFSEDLQDGFSLDGMTIVNPFALTDGAFAALIAD